MSAKDPAYKDVEVYTFQNQDKTDAVESINLSIVMTRAK